MTETESVCLHRIADALERIATALEREPNAGMVHAPAPAREPGGRWDSWKAKRADKELRRKIRAFGQVLPPTEVQSLTATLDMAVHLHLSSQMQDASSTDEWILKVQAFDPLTFDWRFIPMGPKTRERFERAMVLHATPPQPNA